MSDDDCSRAWTGFCRRLEAAGHRILETEGVKTPRERAETLRYLVRELRSALEWDVELADPMFPHFLRLDETGSGPSAAPNLDNWYLAARVDAAAEYRITADFSAINGATFSIHADDWALHGSADLGEFELGPGGRFELRLGSQAQPGNWMRLVPGATFIAIRLYYYDWTRFEPTPIRIERIGSLGETPAPIEPAALAARLGRAASWVEERPYLWPLRKKQQYASTPLNTLRPPFLNPGTNDVIQFGGGRFGFGEDEALLVETEVPQARQWSFQLYTLPWWEPVDITNRVTSLNGTQVHVDADGRVRIVLAHRDPGVQNWLDTASIREGALQYRWIWSRTSPAPSARLLRLDQIRAHLPADTPAFGPGDRRRQIDSRRAYFARRMRY
ncbi:MAG: DUF1214 domain-containing protein [Gammaproteobacteria bacterium]